MTYCVGLLVHEGLAMLADTRTNAGLDNVSSYRKLRMVDAGPGRTMIVASAGSLSVTQAALTRLTDAMLLAGDGDDAPETLRTAPTMFRAATLVGQALHAARAAVDEAVGGDRVSTSATLLFGGASPGANRGCSSSTPAATSSNASPTPRTCRSASTNTASRSSTARYPSTRR